MFDRLEELAAERTVARSRPLATLLLGKIRNWKFGATREAAPRSLYLLLSRLQPSQRPDVQRNKAPHVC
jgi:hypothetical protein